MKELELEFVGKGQVKGFIFTQVKKSESAYLYKVDTDYSFHYEIFERKENTQFNCISYPSDKAFGVWAYTTKSLERANELFEEIELKVSIRNIRHNG